MKIRDLRTETVNGRHRVVSTISWEDSDRPSYDLYFETTEEFASALTLNPHAFLVGSVVPALYYGERRIAIDGEVCPELREGLETAMSWLRHWYYDPARELVQIEADTRSGLPTPRTPDRHGLFFSGGVDAFATLRANRLNYPDTHPGYIRDGILVFGLEMDDPEVFRYVLEYYDRVAHEAKLNLIPIYTNVYLVYRAEDEGNEFALWLDQFQGAAFASIAHALANRFTSVSISASDAIPDMTLRKCVSHWPYGSHPLLDPLYGSSDLRLRHEGIAWSRLEKTRLVAGWDVAMQNLRVCNQFKRYQRDKLNCGQCEKCVRTMLGLEALGVLDKTSVFPAARVSADLVNRVVRFESDGGKSHDDLKASYEELLEPLRKKGRGDLANAIQQNLVARKGSASVRSREILAALDKKYLKGILRRIKKA